MHEDKDRKPSGSPETREQSKIGTRARRKMNSRARKRWKTDPVFRIRRRAYITGHFLTRYWSDHEYQAAYRERKAGEARERYNSDPAKRARKLRQLARNRKRRLKSARITRVVRERVSTDPEYRLRVQERSRRYAKAQQERMRSDPEYAAQRRAYFRLYHKRRHLKDPNYRQNLPSSKKQQLRVKMKQKLQKRLERKQVIEALRKFKANPL
jgi:hypothetical protein